MPYGYLDRDSGRMDNWSEHGEFGGDHGDTPRVYECEAPDCRHHGMAMDDGDMERCQDCEGWFCPTHRVMEKGGHYDVCLACRHQQDIDAVTPKYGND